MTILEKEYEIIIENLNEGFEEEFEKKYNISFKKIYLDLFKITLKINKIIDEIRLLETSMRKKGGNKISSAAKIYKLLNNLNLFVDEKNEIEGLFISEITNNLKKGSNLFKEDAFLNFLRKTNEEIEKIEDI